MITEKISNGGVLSGTINASSNLTMWIGSSNNLVGGNINTFTKEIDPTIPDYIKAISKEDIAGWDNNAVVNEEQNKTLVGLEELIDTITPKNTAKGELVHITDALGLPTFENKVNGNVKQETTRGINLCPTDFSAWESGHYNTEGNKADFLSRIRTIKLYPVQPNTKYYCNCNELNTRHYGFIFRGYGIDNTFVKDYSIVGTNAVFTTDENTHYLGIVIYNDDDTKRFEDIKTDFTNGTIKPFICLDSVTNKTWEKFTGGQASPSPSYKQPIEMLGAYNLLYNNIETQTINGLEVTKNKDGSTTINGTATQDTTLYISHSSTKEKLSLDADDYYINGCPSGGGASTYRIMLYDKSWGYISQDTGNGANFTINEYKENCIATINIIKGATLENIVFKPQIVKGKVNKPYLPYGCVGVKVNRKNLFNDDKFVKDNFNNIVEVENGYTFDIIKSKIVYTLDMVKPNTQYIFKGIIKGLAGANMSITFEYTDGTRKYAYETFSDNSFKITTDGTKTLKLIEMNFYNQTTFKTYTFQDFMLSEENDTYEPYQEQIVPLDLKGSWVGKINDDIKDYLVTDKKKYWLVKNVEKGILSFKRIWANDKFKFAFFDKPTKQLGYGKYLRVPIMSEVSINTASDIEFAITSSGNQLENALLLSLDNPMTIEELKALADGKPFYYPTQETEIIDLGELPEPIKTFEGTNNIQVLANIPAEIEVKYALDVKKYADDRYLELTNALVSTGANL